MRSLRLGGVAAVLVAIVLLPLVGRFTGVGRPYPPRPRGSLASAFSEATAATIDLARSTSVPVAQVGLEVLGDTELVSSLVAPQVSPGPGRDEPNSDATLLQELGDEVDNEVQPLAGTAQRAFDFLLGPPVADGA